MFSVMLTGPARRRSECATVEIKEGESVAEVKKKVKGCRSVPTEH